jgi:type VI secretion system protein VasJ
MPDSDILTSIATNPISGEHPAGESVRYDEAFGKLEAEIGKLENPAGGDIDWRMVEDGTAELLGSTSKDLLLAAWMARAMWQREGLGGLAGGLATIRGLLENFWEPLHPQRIRPRRAALEWLSEKLAAAMGDDQMAGDPAGTSRCISEIEAIVAWSGDHFEGEDCGLLALLSRLRSAALPVADVASVGVSAAGAPAQMVASAPAGPIANRAQAIARLKELAEWWAQHEPSSPMVPLLNRAVGWTELDFQTLFGQLLRTRGDAKEYMWDVLGIREE